MFTTMPNINNSNMKEKTSTKYLGNILSSNGSARDIIQDRVRRKQGRGKVSQILGIISEVPLGSKQTKAGLVLRKAILTNSLLF